MTSGSSALLEISAGLAVLGGSAGARWMELCLQKDGGTRMMAFSQISLFQAGLDRGTGAKHSCLR